MAADRQAAVGAFVLGGTVLALGAIVLFGKFNIFNPTLRAAVVFQDSISGLSVGAPVTFRGVRVGAVNSIAIQFDPRSHTAYIPVVVQLDPSRVQVTARQQQGDGRSGEPDQSRPAGRVEHAELRHRPVGDRPRFRCRVGGRLAPGHRQSAGNPHAAFHDPAVREQLSQLPLRELADNGGATLQSLRTLSENLNTTLPPLIASLKTTSDKSGQAVDDASVAIKDLQARLDVTLDNVNQLAASGDRQVAQRGADLHTLLMSFNQTVLQTRDMLETI